VRKIFLILIFLVLFHNSMCYAQSTVELNIRNLLLKSNDILYKKDIKSMPSIIDYSIEILQVSPNSTAAYYTVGAVAIASSNMQFSPEMKAKFKELYDKYFTSLGDVNSNTVEKIILSELLFSGYSINEMTLREELVKSYQIGQNALQKIKNDCQNKEHVALATMFLLTRLPNDEFKELCKNFIVTYPTYKAIPLMEAKLLMETYFFPPDTQDYLKFIEENKKLIVKYKDIDSPFGNYKIVMCFYKFIVRAYLELEDINNAQKYLEIIKKEAPSYHDLKGIESEVNVYIYNNKSTK